GDDVLVAEATSGTAKIDVAPGHVYRLTLRAYVNGELGAVLATATLDTRPPSGGARSSPPPAIAAATLVKQATGQISVSPEGNITWSTTDLDNARVYVAIDGGLETQYAEGKEGTKNADADFIKPGHTYTFRLRQIGVSPGVGTGEASPPEIQIDTTLSLAIQG